MYLFPVYHGFDLIVSLRGECLGLGKGDTN
jgi:hypothetical protein